MASDSRTDGVPTDDPPARTGQIGWRGRFAVAGRVALASVGGYAVAALATALGALVLPLPRPEAVSAATQASFAVMAGAVVFVFTAASLTRAALGIGTCAALLTGGLWLAGAFSAGSPA